MIPSSVAGVLRRQHYHIVGKHSAVKICLWTKKSIRNQGFCYKQQFYGIESHRCLQMSPAVVWCTHRCVFCWRNVEQTLGTSIQEADDPEYIIEASIAAQRTLLSGFGGLDKADKKKLSEAKNPNQVAISLAGEPTIYPELSSLIAGYKKRGFSVFLVSNGTLPERLASLEPLPTQLYVSLVAPNEETYQRVCKPLEPSLWSKIQKTLEVLPSLSTRKVIRLTLVRGLNMIQPNKYARLIEKAEPDYVEAKAYMFVGGSRSRLTLDNMPSHSEVKDFAEDLASELRYGIKDQNIDSRVVLLSKKP